MLPYDKDYFVIVHDIGQDAARGESTAITKPEGPPVAAQEMAYNLYWAACDEIFNKFK